MGDHNQGDHKGRPYGVSSPPTTLPTSPATIVAMQRYLRRRISRADFDCVHVLADVHE